MPVCASLLAAACFATTPPAFADTQPKPRGVQSPAPAAGAPARMALIVGVEHYAPSSPATVPQLEGCRADAEAVHDLLVNRFGFANTDVHVLIDEQATHEAIVRAWREWLVPRAGPETEVVFWFSGHGARVPDTSGVKGAERGGYDQTILAWDSRARDEDGSYDISDDELCSLYAELAQKTERLFCVVDACHSASGMRGGFPKGALPRVRAADQGKEPLDRKRLLAFWPTIEQEFLEDGDPRRKSTLFCAHVAACGEGQEALEYAWIDQGGQRRSRGALSFFLEDALQHARPRATYREVADEAGANLMRQFSGQTPCFEGGLDRQLFDAHFSEVPRGIPARVTADGSLALSAGTLIGLLHGSQLRIEDAAGAALGRAEVGEIWATHAQASWIGQAPTNAPSALHAFEETRPAGAPAFALFVDDPQLAAALPKREDVTLLDAPRPDAYLLQHKGDALALFAPGGIPLWRSAPDAKLTPAEIASQLDIKWREEQRQRALETVGRGNLPIDAHFRPPTAAESAQVASDWPERHVVDADARALPKATAAVCDARGGREAHKELALAMLEIHNGSQEELFLSVLSVMECRERHPICPVKGDPATILPPGGTKSIPIEVDCAPDWPLERPMRDRYVVLGTRERADFSPFETGAATRGAGEKLEMPAIFKAAIATTRGVNYPVDREKFALTTVDLLVRKP